MTTFFVSQPMDGKTDEEVKADRRKCGLLATSSQIQSCWRKYERRRVWGIPRRYGHWGFTDCINDNNWRISMVDNFTARTRLHGEILYYEAEWKRTPEQHHSMFIIKFLNGKHAGERYYDKACAIARDDKWKMEDNND